METAFERELEIFRTEEEIAQQYFFSYLSINTLPANEVDVLRAMNANALFWITTRHALLLSAFVALGRIFDQNSRHNIDSLLSVAAKNISAFSKKALAARKVAAGLTKAEATAYVADSHELTPGDLKKLRKKVASWRRIYDARYRDIRHKVFAHKALSSVEETNRLLANAKIEEMKELFGFMSALQSALWETFHNGTPPLLNVRGFDLASGGAGLLPGERIYREGHAVLTSMLGA